MQPVGLDKTTISTDYAQKFPRTLASISRTHELGYVDVPNSNTTIF